MNQDEIILNALRLCESRWVSALSLHQRSGSLAVHSRIAHLRSQGHRIRCRVRRAENGDARPSYMLLTQEHYEEWSRAGCPLVEGEKRGRWMLPAVDQEPVKRASLRVLAALTDAVTYAALPSTAKPELAQVIEEALAQAGWQGIRWDASQAQFVA